MPAARGVDWLEPGEGVFPADLAAEERQNVRVRSGDAVLLRTGYGARRRARAPEDMIATGQPGWHAACLPWLHEREVAVIGSDPSQEAATSMCRALDRSEFLLVLASLRIDGGTGSPVNPIAIF